MHFHWSKMEDIINRSNTAILKIQLYNSTPDEQLDETSDVVVSMDGVEHRFPAGHIVELSAGQSITLPQYCYHRFWGEGGRVLIGEVSLVNDDDADNRFAKPIKRFTDIEEDEEPLYLLCTDYPKFLNNE